MALILVVDDNTHIRNVLHQLLGDAGHEVVEAADGRQCIVRVKERLPHIIILDIIMPDQEGLETILQLRGYASEIKIIAMSGGGYYLGVDILSVAQTLGADRILPKPFESREVLGLVEELRP